jgi:hypothetical protein
MFSWRACRISRNSDWIGFGFFRHAPEGWLEGGFLKWGVTLPIQTEPFSSGFGGMKEQQIDLEESFAPGDCETGLHPAHHLLPARNERGED